MLAVLTARGASCVSGSDCLSPEHLLDGGGDLHFAWGWLCVIDGLSDGELRWGLADGERTGCDVVIVLHAFGK